MSQIKLQHSGGNSSIIAAPSSNPSSDVTFRLPNSDGTSNQFMKTDGSGNLVFDSTVYELLNTTTITGASTTITFDSTLITDDFKIYKIQFHGLRGSNNMKVQVSPDNGSNYRTSGYIGSRYRIYTMNTGTSHIVNTDYYSDSLYYSTVGSSDQNTQELTITSIRDSGLKTALIALGGFGDGSVYHTVGIYGARYNTAESHNNIRIIAGSNSFSSGSVSLYGVKT